MKYNFRRVKRDLRQQLRKQICRLVHWEDPEGWNGKGGGRRVQDGEHMYTCGGFIQVLTLKRMFI